MTKPQTTQHSHVKGTMMISCVVHLNKKTENLYNFKSTEFSFKLIAILIQNFLFAYLEVMQAQLDILEPATRPHQTDIFGKYLLGLGVACMPFTLLSQWKHPDQPPTKRDNIRGPYRRYSPHEKDTIIHRMLSGEGLKRIADETAIPKRNLIRWKHEFLHKKTKTRRSKAEQSDQFMEVECRSMNIRKHSMETKEMLSEESLFERVV